MGCTNSALAVSILEIQGNKDMCKTTYTVYGQTRWWNKQGVVYTKFEKIDFPGLLNIDVVHSVNIIWKKTASRLDLDQHSIL